MDRFEILKSIEHLVNQLRENKGAKPIAMQEGTSLLRGDAGFDSLDLAALVVELEVTTGCDPFKQGFVDFDTAGELADLFAGTEA